MKNKLNKITITISLLFGFLFTALPVFAVGETIYTRTPSGTTPSAPVVMTLAHDDQQEYMNTTGAWELIARGANGTDTIISNCYQIEQLSGSITASTFGSSYWRVMKNEYVERDCTNLNGSFYYEESGSPSIPVFTITNPDQIIVLGSISAITGSVSTLFGDLWLLLALIIGIPLAFWTIKRIIEITKIKK